MSNNKQRNNEKVTSFSDGRISKAAMPASETQSVEQSAKSGSQNGANGQQSAKSGSGNQQRKGNNHKDGKSHPSTASQTKAGARSNPNPPAKPVAKLVVESDKPAAKPAVESAVRPFVQTIAFVEKVLPVTGSLIEEAVVAKINQLADTRQLLVTQIEDAKAEGIILKQEIASAEAEIRMLSNWFVDGIAATNRRLDKLADPALEEIAAKEMLEKFQQAVAQAKPWLKIISSAQDEYNANKSLVLAAAKQIRFIDAEIAEWRSML